MKQELLSLFLVKLILVATTITSIGLVLLIGATGYFLTKPKIEPVVSSPIVTPTPAPTIEDETADLSSKALATEDWKTYRNPEFKYSIKYPQGWEIETSKDLGMVTLKESSSNDTITIGKQEGSPNTSLEDNIDYLKNSLEENKYAFKELNEIEISGGKVFLDLSTPDFIKQVYLVNKDNIFTVIHHYYKDSQEIESQKERFLLDKIIPNFHFITSEESELEGPYNKYISEIIGQITGLKNLNIQREYGNYGIDSEGNKNYLFLYIGDLNNDNNDELVLTQYNYNKSISKVYVATMIRGQESIYKYKKIGELNLEESWFPKKGKEINGDNTGEVFLDMQAKGPGHWQTYAVLVVDFEAPKIDLIKAKDFQGNIIDKFEFVGGGGRCFYSGWVFDKDLNNDGKKEIASLGAVPNVSEICNYFNKNDSEDTCHKCKLSVYQWDGSVFSYNKGLSELAKNKINLKEFEGSSCNVCVWE